MGEVYLARDTRLDRKVAIKILASERDRTAPARLGSSRLARLRREATALARLNHPNIVSVHSIEETDNRVFVVMEWIDGVRLRDLIPSSGFEFERFLELAIPIARALQAAHASGVTHRDLKPENIMVSRSGTEPGGTVKVLDFGLARLHESDDSPHEETLTAEQQVLGTLPYMSPEQLTGDEVGPASDLFSLGTVFYEMLTGRRPFVGDSNVTLSKAILHSEPEQLSSLSRRCPPALSTLIEQCHQKDPRDRPKTASYVVSRLVALKEGRPVSKETQTLEQTSSDLDLRTSTPSPSSSTRTLSIDDLSPSRARTQQSQRSERFSVALALLAAVVAAVIAINLLPRSSVEPADSVVESMIVLPFEKPHRQRRPVPSLDRPQHQSSRPADRDRRHSVARPQRRIEEPRGDAERNSAATRRSLRRRRRASGVA